MVFRRTVRGLVEALPLFVGLTAWCSVSYLRQTVLLSAYETPETRALFNQSLKNVAGKIRTEKRWTPIEVPEGIDQNFVQFDCSNPKDEPEKRFQHFTTQVCVQVAMFAGGSC